MLHTKYARRWLEMRMRIHHVVMQKVAEDGEPHPRTVEEIEVQHIRLKGDLDQVTEFEKTTHVFREGHVILRSVYRGFDEPVLIFLCIVEENDLRQQVMVEVRPSASGIYVALTGFGAPVVTYGVKEAVRAVAKYLQARGMELIEVAV
jgi:tRNA (guanine-N7-)-methyltransferase